MSSVRDGRREQTRSQIVAAGIRIIDTDGFDALSMRRVAAALDMGTMSLYSYVRNKDELVLLLADAVGRELLLDEVPADWKQALTEIARASRAALLRHPWIFTINWEGSVVAASFLHHVDQSLQAVSGLGVDRETQMAILRTVDDFTFGNAFDANREAMRTADRPEFPAGEVRRIAEDEGLSYVTAMMAEHDDQPPETHFEQGLAWVLAGIEASLAA